MMPGHGAHPRRVMYVIWSLGLGGAEQVVIRLAAGLDRARFAPLIVCMNEPGPFAEQARRSGIEVTALYKRGAIDLGMLARLIRMMRRQRIGIVHTHLWGAGLWGRLAAWLAGVPVVIAHEHGMQPWRGGLHFFCDRLLAGVTDCVLFASEQVMHAYCARTGVAPAKCRVIPNGVAVEPTTPAERAAARRARGWSDEDVVVMSIGRLSPEKGYKDLLEAIALMKSQGGAGRVRLVLVGDGVERAALERQRAQQDLNGQVTFAGRQENVRPWLAAADLYVQPSRREGLPLAVLEAMAAGVPVIATSVGDVPQLIDSGRTGYLVAPQRPEELANAIVMVAQRRQAQRPLIEAARRVVEERYALGQMIRAVEQVYEGDSAARR